MDIKPVIKIQIRWIRKIFAFWIRIQGANISTENCKKKFTLKNPNLKYLKKERF